MTVKAVALIKDGPFPHNSSGTPSTTYDLDIAFTHLPSSDYRTTRMYDISTGLITSSLLSAIKDFVKAECVTNNGETWGIFDSVVVIGATL